MTARDMTARDRTTHDMTTHGQMAARNQMPHRNEQEAPK